MRKLLLGAALLICFAPFARGDEGMWLPSLIGSRIADMQAKGLKLSAEDIYSVNQASLKDAVLLFGGGCTGEMVSGEGLLLTNHHCGYYHVARHSSVEHDYLRDGFWAMTRDAELPCPGLTVSFLERMEDVTDMVLSGIGDSANERVRDSIVRAHSKAIADAATGQRNGVHASVEPLYYGNQYFLFIYKTYRDVRLVGAPPSSIGKFGGDTDNWMWPRHTGDFSMFRIYASSDNEPADYSTDNVPYMPKKYFKISGRGVKEGDFTFIYGNPGSTQEYITGEAVRWIGEVADPEKIAIRDLRLSIIKSYMARSQELRIMYSSRAASVANAWKKWQGESLGIKRMKTVAAKKAYEARFADWAKGGKYEGVVESIDSLLRLQEPYDFARFYYQETAAQVELAKFASAFASSDLASMDEKEYHSRVEGFFNNYWLPVDKECFVATVGLFEKNVSQDFKPAYFKEQMNQFGSVQAWADHLFGSSVFASKESLLQLNPEKLAQAALEDPAVVFAREMDRWYKKTILPKYQRYNAAIRILQRKYMQGMMEMEPGRVFYPDANLTLRVAYGKVEGYSPADGVYYEPVSTLKGVMEKDNPDIFDYNIPQVLRDLYARDKMADVPVCFLATNHTTGGNSGSPVIDGEGNLIGINFDRVWEGTMSDIVFDPDYCRNISLDIRYLLFVVGSIGHAQHLLDEMTIVN